MTYLTKCQIKHLIKMYFQIKYFNQNDKRYLYYLSTLWVWLVKMAFGLVKKDKYCLYQLDVENLMLGKLNIYNVNNVCFISLVKYQIRFEQTILMFILVHIILFLYY
jgi:hypothetical protein